MTNTVKWNLEHVQTHDKNNNSMEPRTLRSIALRPSGNKQWGHYFLSLHTENRILRNHWTVLPIPNDVIDTVHRLPVTSKQAGGITFTDIDGNIITDNHEEETEELMENDEPIPVPENNHEDVINAGREETNEEAITGVDEQNTVDAHDITITCVDEQNIKTHMTTHYQNRRIKMRQLQEWTMNRTQKTHLTIHNQFL